MKRVIYSNFLPIKGFKAINLFGIIFARKEESGLDERILTHESVHTRQMIELLVIGFYIWYVMEWLLKWIRYKDRYTAYRNICFEREAYDNDTDPFYPKQRSRYAFIKYL
ncbi:hypothetical protein SDC9_197822 [bioreactor metagenome]|uniref:DUF4157 domain-containing protein n=1 Tax=bioreactor metagenome TaxID=1076179 RepID=A0A645IGT9_9ZZZZ|nr:hypothetical protein [Proteiniphilum sp.]MEA4917108.1 hypothetical protein [Proteiniphilum sp.]